MSDRRRFLSKAAFTALIGALAFFRVSTKPRFEAIHVLDVIGLMTAGAGFAVAHMMVILFFVRGPRAVDGTAGENSGEKSN